MLCEELYRELKNKFAFAQDEVEAMFKEKVNLDAEDPTADAHNVSVIHKIDDKLSKKYGLEVGFYGESQKNINEKEKQNNNIEEEIGKTQINNKEYLRMLAEKAEEQSEPVDNPDEGLKF